MTEAARCSTSADRSVSTSSGPDCELRPLGPTQPGTRPDGFARLASLHAEMAHVYGQMSLADGGKQAVMGEMNVIPAQLSLDQLLEDYLSDLKLRVSERHYYGVRTRLTKVVAGLGVDSVGELVPMHVMRYRNQLLETGVSNRTVDTYLGPLKSMLNWAVEMGLIERNPIANIKRLASKRDKLRCKRRALTDDEIERFLAASLADDEEQELKGRALAEGRIPQTPMWRALLETGARWNELRQIKWSDVDFDQRVLVLRAENTKSKKKRAIPLGRDLVAQLNRLRPRHEELRGRTPEEHDAVFLTPEGCEWGWPTTNAGRILARLLDRAQIDKIDSEGLKIDIHALRHTFGSRLARQNVALVKTQRLMGHSDPKLTEAVYTHLDVEDLREAIDQLPSLSKEVPR